MAAAVAKERLPKVFVQMIGVRVQQRVNEVASLGAQGLIELDLDLAVPPLQFADDLFQRMRTAAKTAVRSEGQLLRAIGAYDQHAPAADAPSQMQQQTDGRNVGPV